MNTDTRRTLREGTTVRWSAEALDEFHARLRDSKRLLDAFPGPLPGPCLLREVPDAGGGAVEAVPLSGCVVVGRHGDAPLAFAADKAMSGRHFRILAGRDGRCYADDLRSKNGLWVNGRRVEYRFLVHGDCIHAGSQDFVFHDGQGPAAERPPWV